MLLPDDMLQVSYHSTTWRKKMPNFSYSALEQELNLLLNS